MPVSTRGRDPKNLVRSSAAMMSGGMAIVGMAFTMRVVKVCTMALRPATWLDPWLVPNSSFTSIPSLHTQMSDKMRFCSQAYIISRLRIAATLTAFAAATAVKGPNYPQMSFFSNIQRKGRRERTRDNSTRVVALQRSIFASEFIPTAIPQLDSTADAKPTARCSQLQHNGDWQTDKKDRR